ncbi:Uncharacterised protein [Metamycoplasma arthritidis]|uniref:Hypothetical membrane protein n=1 Tax=Metamycoplasma arthritidis (strain 158L3-1) TaxID=243272 RepID=B3PMV9_META1|nr:hypothetical protein [Metamycoplasma arthritidis]ACF07361.1 hypothetical membrane protein [Metamycoplasma arthritidis 158L3-1]VEU78883.1 Uncharacterised protein [Metamycoplasma arthritidis]
MNKKILLSALMPLAFVPAALLSTSSPISKKLAGPESNKNLASQNQSTRQNSKLKYAITIDNKEMTFDSKEDIYKYLLNKVQVNGYIGKKEYKNYDGQIDMDPNKLNLVDYSKMKKAYRDIHGNYSDDLDSVIRSYLPEFAIVKRYYDHRNQPYKEMEDAKNSIIKNSTDDIVDNLFYKLNYSSNGQIIEKHYNPYNEYDIKELMQDIHDRKVLSNSTKTIEALKLEADDGSERFLTYKGFTDNFFSTLFTNAIKEFTDQAVKNRYKVTLKLPRMDNMNYPDYGKAYFNSFSSEGYNEWQYANSDRTEIYKYVDEDWIKTHFKALELLKNGQLAKEFVDKNFNRYYSEKLWKKVKNPRYNLKGPRGSSFKYTTVSYWNHYADLKGKFLDFKSLNLVAKNNEKNTEYITVLNHDRWTYNNFGLEVNVELDKDNFETKMNNLKNEFKEESDRFAKFEKLLTNIIKKLVGIRTDEIHFPWKRKKYFFDYENKHDLLKMLWNVYEENLNNFIHSAAQDENKIYAGLRFDESKTYYRRKKEDPLSSWESLDLIKVFSCLEIKIEKEKVFYRGTIQPIFYKNKAHEFVNLTNKKISSNEYLDFINPNEIQQMENNSEFIKSQKEFAIQRKINYIDNYSNYFDIKNLTKFKYKNFIQYKESLNGSYQLNNSYSPLKTFKDDTEVNEYLKRIKEDGILPETRYTIVGLESTLDSHGIKMLLEELEFNDPSTITNNYRMILQKLILPSKEKIFYLDNGQKYLLDLKYFNLWNIKINNEEYHFESSPAITQFIKKYVDLHAKPIAKGVK